MDNLQNYSGTQIQNIDQIQGGYIVIQDEIV